MSEFDDIIKRELEEESSEIDELLASDDGLPDIAVAKFKSNIRRWMWAMVTGLLLWASYNFYVATTVDERLFWGVWFIIGVMVLITLKQWRWMEINRSSMMREIKRFELTAVSLKKYVD